MNLLHLIVRGLRERPGRALLSVASVAIAVAAVLGTALSQSSVRQGMRELSGAVDKYPALELVAAAGGRFASEIAPKVDGAPGVVAAVPVINRATMARVNGERFRTVLVGIPVDTPVAWEALGVEQGRACREAGEAVLSADLAKGLKAKIGDRLIVISRRGPRSATVVGLADAGALAAFAPAASVAMPLADVQGFFGLGGQIDRLRVLLASADDRQTATEAISPLLTEELVVQSPASPTETIDATLRSTELALRLAGALSMAMAAFIILNTLRLNFSERRRTLAVVRVLGATSKQLMVLQLLEGTLLGLVGSAVGVPLGLLLGRGLAQATAAILGVEVPPAEVPYQAVALVIVLGPIVAAIAAIVPALQSRAVSPVEAMGDSELRRAEKFPLWAAVLGIAFWTMAVTLVLLVVAGRLAPEAAIPAGLLMLVAFITVIPAVIRPLLRGIGGLLSPWLRIEGRLASEQLRARATRTGLTVGVLVVALSAGLGLGTAIVNNVNDVRGWYRRSLAGDVFLTNSAATDETTASERGQDLAAEVRGLEGVERVVEIRLLSAKINGASAMCVVRDFTPQVDLPWVLSPAADEELRAGLEAGQLALSGVMAQQLGVEPGDTLRLEVQGRVHSLRVAALVNDYMLGGRVAYIDQRTAAAMFNLGPPFFMIVDARAGSSVDDLVSRCEETLAGQGIVVQSFAELRRQLDGLIDGVVGALWGLMAVGFLVGGIAVSNTLTLNVIEQTRELGLLRIIGMTPAQTRRLVFSESLLLGLVGALTGTLGGLTTAVVIHLCNDPVLGRSIPFQLHPWLLAANAGGCLLIALVAAWRPGVWASRLNVLAAIAYE